MKKRSNKSGFRGVYKNHTSGWQAQICIGPRSNKTRVMLGTFATQAEAAEAYDDAAREHHGARAILNFPGIRTKNRDRTRMERKAASAEKPLVNDDRFSQPVMAPAQAPAEPVVMVPTEKPRETPTPELQPVPERVTRQAKVIQPGCCPACGSSLYQTIGSSDDAKRCLQCGHQPRRGEVDSNRRRILHQDGVEEVFSPTGVSRGQFADGEWRRAHLQKGIVAI